MSTLLVAASNAAQGIIKNIIQGSSSMEDDMKLESVSISKNNKLSTQNYDDEKDFEIEEVPQKLSVSSEIEVQEASEEEAVLEQEAEEEEADAESELLSAEMELALANVRKLASYQQESLVNDICDIYASFNGSEPSVNDLSAIFVRIKKSLALESAEAELEEDEDELNDENDSDYSPADGEDNLQYLLDLQDADALDNEKESSSSSPEEEDADYDPQDAGDLDQAALDEQYDNESEEDVSMESVNPSKIDFSEETIINSESFDDEYFQAMESVKQRGQFDKAAILAKIKEEYTDIFAEEATNDMILEAFEQFVSSADEEEVDEDDEDVEEEEEEFDEVSEEESEDVPVDPEEFESALSHIRSLAKEHQSSLVDNISDTFKSLNGVEPSEEELLSILDLLKSSFADEARDDFLDQVYEEKETESS